MSAHAPFDSMGACRLAEVATNLNVGAARQWVVRRLACSRALVVCDMLCQQALHRQVARLGVGLSCELHID